MTWAKLQVCTQSRDLVDFQSEAINPTTIEGET